MEFGHIDREKLAEVNFKLPQDHPDTKKNIVLNRNVLKSFSMHVGLSVWSNEYWKGHIYPPTLSKEQFLDYYAKSYNTVEMGSSYYGMQPDKVMQKWSNKVGVDFIFCPKVSKEISHLNKLENSLELTDQFFRALKSLGNKLGPSYLQLPENFGIQYFNILREYLKYCKENEYDVFLELRSKEWFNNNDTSLKLRALLASHNIGWVITDTAGRRDMVDMYLSGSRLFVRFVANDGHPSDKERLKEWIERIKSWKDEGLSEVWFFIHSHFSETTPIELSDWFAREVNKQLDIKLKIPKRYKDNQDQLSFF